MPAKKTKTIIAAQPLIGDFGTITEGDPIPKDIPIDTVKSWLTTGAAMVKGSEGDVGHWNEKDDADLLADLPDEPLPLE